MTLNLVRFKAISQGVFGRLLTDDNTQLAVTLEHSYGEAPPTAKIPAGTYLVQWLDHPKWGWAFELQAVPHHTAILIHAGNVEHDSAGCILLGTDITEGWGVTQSYKAMYRLLQYTHLVPEFTLRVVNP